MDMFKVMREACSAEKIKKTSNYYYENHICEKSGNNIKIHLDYTLSTDKSDEIMRFGVCGDCGTCFYHNDFHSSGF